MDKVMLYWLFSTIAQTYGAIVGVIGMLTVYRLQILSNYIKEAMDSTKKRRESHFAEAAYGQDVKEFIEGWNNRKTSSREFDKNDIKFLTEASDNLRRTLDQIEKIKVRGINFLLTHLIIIVLSIVALLFCGILEKHIIISIFTLLLIGGFLVWSFYVMRNLFFTLFQMEKKEYKKKQKEIWQTKYKYLAELKDKLEQRLRRFIIKYF